jgi:hypothetical protein
MMSHKTYRELSRVWKAYLPRWEYRQDDAILFAMHTWSRHSLPHGHQRPGWLQRGSLAAVDKE